MNKGFIFLSFIFIAFALFGEAEGEKLIKSYLLTKKVLIVGIGDKYTYPLAAINTKKGLVVIDSGSPPSITAMYKRTIEKEFGCSDFKYIINTHSHADHFEGNQVFKGAEIIAHENALKKMIEEKVFYEKEFKAYNIIERETIKRKNILKDSLKKDSDLFKDLRDRGYIDDIMCNDYETIFKLTLPTITFTDSLTLEMGDLKLHLVFFGPDFHSGNDIIISIPEERIVFTGDILTQKYMFSESRLNARSNFDPWINCLDKVFKNNRDIKNVVTFHFGVLPGLALRDFYVALKNMKNDQLNKENAVEKLRLMISTSGLKTAENKFKDQFLKKRDEKYFIWENEMVFLAKEYQREKKYDEAIMVLNLCKRIFQDSTTSLNMLGAILKKIGKKQLAINVYKELLERGPINPASTADKIFQLERSN